MVDAAVIQTVLTSVLSGGGTAVTAFTATFRDIKKRLTKVEERVGNDGVDGDPKTGLYLVVERLDEIARKVKALSVVDNTFLSPYFQKPFEFDDCTH